MTITVRYLPAHESSPLPNGAKAHIFASSEEFKVWVQSYVCTNCLVDYHSFAGAKPETLADWLDGGCGCEIGIHDDGNTIEWESKMVQPKDLDDQIAMSKQRDLSESDVLPDGVMGVLTNEKQI